MFEKLVRNLMMACSIPKEGENSPEIQKKAKKFMKFLTRHITLILIVKNGTLSQQVINELNPTSLFDRINDFLYEK